MSPSKPILASPHTHPSPTWSPPQPLRSPGSVLGESGPPPPQEAPSQTTSSPAPTHPPPAHPTSPVSSTQHTHPPAPSAQSRGQPSPRSTWTTTATSTTPTSAISPSCTPTPTTCAPDGSPRITPQTTIQTKTSSTTNQSAPHSRPNGADRRRLPRTLPPPPTLPRIHISSTRNLHHLARDISQRRMTTTTSANARPSKRKSPGSHRARGLRAINAACWATAKRSTRPPRQTTRTQQTTRRKSFPTFLSRVVQLSHYATTDLPARKAYAASGRHSH